MISQFSRQGATGKADPGLTNTEGRRVDRVAIETSQRADRRRGHDVLGTPRHDPPRRGGQNR